MWPNVGLRHRGLSKYQMLIRRLESTPGCDDATVSFQGGDIIIDFAREAETMEQAIASAVECVKATGARVQRVELQYQDA